MLRWSPPSKEKPSVESKRYFSPTPDDLRTLVFDYLCHNSYTDTARLFMRESVVHSGDILEDETMDVDDGMPDTPIDLASEERLRVARLRREIKVQILSGRVDDAIALLNTYFPAVLSPSSHDQPMQDSSLSADTFKYIAPRSVDSNHLLLDLHILAFIEASRTRPSPYYPPGSAAPSPPLPSSTLPTVPRTSHVRDDVGPDKRQQILFHKAQRLYSDASCLPKPEDRALYIKELGNVTALLAYPVPEESDLVGYLSQARREEMAEQIEGAILHHIGELAASKIELGVRHTAALWNWMHTNDIPLPPQAKWPAGIQLPVDGLASSGTKSTEPPAAADRMSPGKKPHERAGEMRAPRFDLTDFVNAKFR